MYIKQLALVVLLCLSLRPTPSVAPREHLKPNLQRQYGRLLMQHIRRECKRWGVPLQMVKNIIASESQWRYPEHGQIVGHAIVASTAGALGLMQVQLPTAREILFDHSLSERQLLEDDFVNTTAGIRYLAWLRKYYNGNWAFAVAAYHRGMARVNKDILAWTDPRDTYVHTVFADVILDAPIARDMAEELHLLSAKPQFAISANN